MVLTKFSTAQIEKKDQEVTIMKTKWKNINNDITERPILSAEGTLWYPRVP